MAVRFSKQLTLLAAPPTTTMHFTEQGFIGLPGIIITSKFTEHHPHLPVSKHHRDMSSLDQWEASQLHQPPASAAFCRLWSRGLSISPYDAI